MKYKFTKDKIELEDEVQRIENQINNLENFDGTYIEEVQKYMQFKDVVTINKNVLSSLVDEILVDREKNITVNFKFKDEIREYYKII